MEVVLWLPHRKMSKMNVHKDFLQNIRSGQKWTIVDDILVSSIWMTTFL
jgi:hypothetical protein